jgi:hypothetical protein
LCVNVSATPRAGHKDSLSVPKLYVDIAS